MPLSSTAERASVDTLYATGEYFADPQRHGEDAAFKASRFLSLLGRSVRPSQTQIASYVDVGSGSGHVVRLVLAGLRDAGFGVRTAKGYDVSPHVQALARGNGVEFVHADFCAADEFADLVTLFDVVEHVPDPIGFIKSVSERCRIIGLHIPLDDSINAAFRDLYRGKVKVPGHLIFVDAVAALNLLALAGLRVLDYEYTLAFEAPSGGATIGARLIRPLRALMAKISPWLLSKTLGGPSLMVVALTPAGVRSVEARR